MATPANVLVVANETVGGEKLFEAIERRAAKSPIRCTVICPQNRPSRGYVIYDESARSAAGIRLDLTLERLRKLGIEATGEIMDPDPYMAVKDALRDYGADEIIISTLPYARSGWLRRDLVDRIRSYAKLPVEHVIVDLNEEPTRHTLVVANQTVGGEKLLTALKRRASESPHRFTVISPQDGALDEATERAEQRLQGTLRELEQAGLDVTGYVTHPDPFTSIMNTVEADPPNDIIVSTLPQVKSGWLRGDLIGRVRRATGLPVEHVVSDPETDARTPVLAAPSTTHAGGL
jgi:nucleotide-binding universal stress UspA family protein